MQRISAIEEHIPKNVVRCRARDGSWIDLICNQLAPVRGQLEAFTFRVTAIDNELFRAEIHWDDGIGENISDCLTTAAVIDVINGYYTGYHARMERHETVTALVTAGQRGLADAVADLCSSLRTVLDETIGNVEMEVLIAYIGINGGLSHTMAACRLDCICEMKKIRRDMDSVFRELAAGTEEQMSFIPVSHHSLDILIYAHGAMDLVYEHTKADNTNLIWALTEMKFQLRLHLQDNYQQRFALFTSDSA